MPSRTHLQPQSVTWPVTPVGSSKHVTSHHQKKAYTRVNLPINVGLNKRI
jgi:hypothetical protein